MSFASSVDITRVVTSQTSPMTTPKAVYPTGGQLHGARCCETGRPVALDPVTGSTVCSCQLKTGVPAYLSRVPSLPETVYGSGNGHLFQPNVVMGTDAAAAFYHMQGLKSVDRSTDSNVKTSPHSGHPPYYLDHIMAAQNYNTFYSGLDINSARRKNATRETTSALKAWLYEHRKNPYPTKGEKIMLAIITRMTLTQVSTWFANARRRLKKENRIDGREDDLSDIEIDDPPMKNASISSELSSNNTDNEDDNRRAENSTDLSDISDTEEPLTRALPAQSSYNNPFAPEQQTKTNTGIGLSPAIRGDTGPRHVSMYVNGELNKPVDDDTKQCKSRDTLTSGGSGNVAPKPKIWSISEIISNPKESKTS